MSRTDSWVGLTPRAGEWLKANAELTALGVPAGSVHFTFEGAFYNKMYLHMYPLKEGGIVYEVVCADPWSSGPNYFTTLQRMTLRGLEPIPDITWTDQEIEEYL